ncbi:MAG TPA: hypothetical protein VJ889_28850 [Pseudomonas sp.]|nr:hypothetical protein [Pseudomonas sp.]
MNLRSLIVAVLMVLAGCVTPPPAPVAVVPVVVVSESTWQQVDQEIVAASQQATEQARVYARGSMEHWRTRVYQQTEEVFIPWFSSYWTQEWLSLKVSWYAINAGDEEDASAKRLAAYLLEQYHQKVLAPVAVEIDPDQILAQATAFYVQLMGQQLEVISQRHGVPMAQLNQRIQKIPAISLGPPPTRDASLYQVVHAELGKLPAYLALIETIHTAGGDRGIGSTDAGMAPVAKRASRRIEAEMAPRGAASAVAAVAGKAAGALISVGVAGVRAIIQANDRPDSEALIRSSLGNSFDKAWLKLVQNPATGVMAGTLYMARQIEGSLAPAVEQSVEQTAEQTAEPSVEPSVSLGAGTVDWSHAGSTTQQINP